MSFNLVKASTCINLQIFSTDHSSGSRFHPLQVKHGLNYKLKGSSRQCQRRRTFTVSCNLQAPPPTPPTPPPAAPSNPFSGLPGRKGWIAGAVLTFLLPFLTNKWGPILLFKKQIDEKLQTVEDVAETLEKVADRVEHIAEDVAKDLPEGPLKNAAVFVENVAEKLEATAHLTDETIDKIQEFEDDVESRVKSNKEKLAESKNEEKSGTIKQA